MKHFAIHKLSKTQPSLLSKVSDRLCCGDGDSAVYFYHSDHLGSASWITNGSGNPVQHLQYMPYGEPFVNERTSSYNERFTFTGKERDSETGFSYFGARYYDSDLMTGWLSVDPLADKYPNLSPYAYCAWNPVRLVDPDGEELVFTGESEYVNSLLKIMNSCFSFSSDVFSIVDGKVQSRELNSEELSLMSEKQQAFYTTIMSAVNDDETISIGIVNNRKDVLFGSWDLNTIDVADMQALGDGEGLNMYAAIGHEIAEQQYKQTSSIPSYPIGHYKYGLKAEEKISGYFRTSEYGALKCITVNSSNYKEGYHIQVNIHSNLNDEIESVIRIKKPINFGR